VRRLGAVALDERLGEVSKPWYPAADDHRVAAIEYLSDRHVPDWEPQADAVSRFGAVVEAVDDGVAVAVTHGTVLALWLKHFFGDFDAVSFWLRLEMPDAYSLDLDDGTLNCLSRPLSG
jgi:broad specificity phosphatase PhoE